MAQPLPVPDQADPQPPAADAPTQPPAADAPAPAPSAPWLDSGASWQPLPVSASRSYRGWSLAALGGLYGGFSTWAYFAWYHDVPELPAFKWGGDGWFGQRTYAGGADKLGHLWATMVLGRGSIELLRWGGWDRTSAALIGASMSWGLFAFVELKDGYYYQMSPGDMVGNSIGAVLAFAFSAWPKLDDAFDFRVQYWPSDAYQHEAQDGDIDIAEDYSGQTFLLAYHLGSIPGAREHAWSRVANYVDVAVGFETRDYKPLPPEPYERRQSLFLGVTLNLQGAIDDALQGHRGAAGTIRKIGHGLTEIMNAPFTTLPVLETTRSPDR